MSPANVLKVPMFLASLYKGYVDKPQESNDPVLIFLKLKKPPKSNANDAQPQTVSPTGQMQTRRIR